MNCLRPLKHVVVGSNLTRVMDVRMCLFCVRVIMREGIGLARADPREGSLTDCE
jgi:hypothetical protein